MAQGMLEIVDEEKLDEVVGCMVGSSCLSMEEGVKNVPRKRRVVP